MKHFILTIISIFLSLALCAAKIAAPAAGQAQGGSKISFWISIAVLLLLLAVLDIIIVRIVIAILKNRRTSRTVWIVKYNRDMREEQFSNICGVYDDEIKAKARVNEIFEETKQFYKDVYAETKQKFKSENSGNGFATVWLIANEDYDTTKITAAKYTLNVGTCIEF